MEFFLPTSWDDGRLYDAVLSQRPRSASSSPWLPWRVRWPVGGCPRGAQAEPAMWCPARQGTAGHLLCGCCKALPGCAAELSSACTHMQRSIARAGSPSSSSLVPELVGEPASKQNFPLVSLFSEAACLRRCLSVALKPAWEWAPLPHSSWLDSH